MKKKDNLIMRFYDNNDSEVFISTVSTDAHIIVLFLLLWAHPFIPVTPESLYRKNGHSSAYYLWP